MKTKYINYIKEDLEMTKEQILGVIMVYAAHALGCWGCYYVGKRYGANKAYYDCTERLKNMTDLLREKYPEVFEKE